MDNDVNIRIRQTLEGNSLPEVKAQLKAVQQEMNATNRTTAEGVARYKELSAGAGQLTTRLTELSREQKGLTAQTNLSGAGMLNLGKNLAAITIGAIEVTKAIGQVVMKMKEMVMQGAEYGVLKDNFDKLAGGTEIAVQQLDLMRKAAGGELNNTALIEYSAKMKLLGFSADDSSKLLFLVHERSEQIGVSFDKGNKALQSFIVTGRAKGLQQLGINVADVNSEMERLINATGKTKDEFGEEEIQAIRTNAVLNISKISLEDVEKATLSTAGKLKSLETATANAKLEIGNFVAKGLVGAIESLGLTSDSAIKTTGTLSSLGSTVVGLIPVMAGLKLALGGAFVGVATTIGLISAGLVNLAAHFNNISGLIDILTLRIFDNYKQSWAWKNLWGGAEETSTKGELGLMDKYKNTVGLVRKALMPKFMQLPEYGPTREDYVEPTDKTKGTGRGSTTKEEKEVLTMLQQEINKRDELQKSLELNINDLGAVLELTKQIADANERILFLQTGQQPWYKKTVSTLGSERLISAEDTGIPNRGYKAYETARYKMSSEDALKGAVESTGKIRDIFTNLSSTLNIGADTFIGKMISGFDTVLGIMNTIMAVVEAEKTVSSFLSLLIPGLATGGLLQGAGTGTSDSILARVSHGEYVVNASATSQYLPFLNAINGGSNNLSNMFQRYANGGMVSGGNSALKVDMPEVKIKGSDIYLSWRRQGRKEAGRIG